MQLLQPDHYKNFLQDVAEPGIEECHVALIQPIAGANSIRAYVKLYAPIDADGKKTRGLVNEVVGYSFAKACGLMVPSQAGLIRLEARQLIRLPAWLQAGDVLCWWSEDVHYPTIKAQFNLSALPANSSVLIAALEEVRKALLKRSGVEKLVAFDDIVANVDRNLGNILDTPAHLTLIDHGRILTGPTWVGPDLDPDTDYPNVLRRILSMAGESLPYKSALAREMGEVGKILKQELDSFDTLVRALLGDKEKDAAERFLRQRSNGGNAAAKRAGLLA